MNIVLVGYRGTGKSAVAQRLGARLGLEVLSLDAEIVRAAGQPIPEIVQQRGWPAFRDLEEQAVRAAAARDGAILDCGGGVIERDANYAVLRAAGPVFWLRASTETIVRRIEGDDQRPSLTGAKSFTDEVAEVLQRRTPLYQRIAHHTIDTDDRSIDDVAKEICRICEASADAPQRAAEGTANSSTAGREAYNVVSDTVAGVNIRKSDNLFQLKVILVCTLIGILLGAIAGALLSDSDNRLFGVLGGGLGLGFAGVVLGLFGSGIYLMIYRAVRHLKGDRD